MKDILFTGSGVAIVTPFRGGAVNFPALGRLIDRQIERAAITSISGFAKPYQEASKVLTV